MTVAPVTSTGNSRWALMPVALLLASTLGVGSLALIAMHDPNFALEPDYYKKALHWDQTQAQAGENRRLGYHVAAEPRVVLDAANQAALFFTLTDANGNPVSGATVHADAFANAFSGEINALTLEERAPGVYAVTLTARHVGLWEFRLVVQSGSERFTTTVRRDLVRGAA